MKGIILCGGSGSRLEPLTTQYGNKHLVPIYPDYPMVCSPINTLKQMGCKEILIITSSDNCGQFVNLLKGGKHLDLDITYKIQPENDGILGALKLAKNFVGNSERFVVILGDNHFELDFTRNDLQTICNTSYFRLFTKYVKKDASRFGVVTDKGIVEKPKHLKDGNVVTGLYIYPNEIFYTIDGFKKSIRGEYEITDLNNFIMSKMVNDMPIESHLYKLNNNEFWSDCGTIETMNLVRKRMLKQPPYDNILSNPFLNNIK